MYFERLRSEIIGYDSYFHERYDYYLPIEQALKFANEITSKDMKFQALLRISDQIRDQNKYDYLDEVFKMMLEMASSMVDPNERINFFYDITDVLLRLPCEEQEKYIEKFVSAYDKL
jgi:F0F1-type ATP synthase delta subunit